MKYQLDSTQKGYEYVLQGKTFLNSLDTYSVEQVMHCVQAAMSNKRKIGKNERAIAMTKRAREEFKSLTKHDPSHLPYILGLGIDQYARSRGLSSEEFIERVAPAINKSYLLDHLGSSKLNTKFTKSVYEIFHNILSSSFVQRNAVVDIYSKEIAKTLHLSGTGDNAPAVPLLTAYSEEGVKNLLDHGGYGEEVAELGILLEHKYQSMMPIEYLLHAGGIRTSRYFSAWQQMEYIQQLLPLIHLKNTGETEIKKNYDKNFEPLNLKIAFSQGEYTPVMTSLSPEQVHKDRNNAVFGTKITSLIAGSQNFTVESDSALLNHIFENWISYKDRAKKNIIEIPHSLEMSKTWQKIEILMSDIMHGNVKVSVNEYRDQILQAIADYPHEDTILRDISLLWSVIKKSIGEGMPSYPKQLMLCKGPEYENSNDGVSDKQGLESSQWGSLEQLYHALHMADIHTVTTEDTSVFSVHINSQLLCEIHLVESDTALFKLFKAKEGVYIPILTSSLKKITGDIHIADTKTSPYRAAQERVLSRSLGEKERGDSQKEKQDSFYITYVQGKQILQRYNKLKKTEYIEDFLELSKFYNAQGVTSSKRAVDADRFPLLRPRIVISNDQYIDSNTTQNRIVQKIVQGWEGSPTYSLWSHDELPTIDSFLVPHLNEKQFTDFLTASSLDTLLKTYEDLNKICLVDAAGMTDKKKTLQSLDKLMNQLKEQYFSHVYKQIQVIYSEAEKLIIEPSSKVSFKVAQATMIGKTSFDNIEFPLSGRSLFVAIEQMKVHILQSGVKGDIFGWIAKLDTLKGVISRINKDLVSWKRLRESFDMHNFSLLYNKLPSIETLDHLKKELDIKSDTDYQQMFDTIDEKITLIIAKIEQAKLMDGKNFLNVFVYIKNQVYKAITSTIGTNIITLYNDIVIDDSYRSLAKSLLSARNIIDRNNLQKKKSEQEKEVSIYMIKKTAQEKIYKAHKYKERLTVRGSMNTSVGKRFHFLEINMSKIQKEIETMRKSTQDYRDTQSKDDIYARREYLRAIRDFYRVHKELLENMKTVVSILYRILTQDADFYNSYPEIQKHIPLLNEKVKFYTALFAISSERHKHASIVVTQYNALYDYDKVNKTATAKIQSANVDKGKKSKREKREDTIEKYVTEDELMDAQSIFETAIGDIQEIIPLVSYVRESLDNYLKGVDTLVEVETQASIDKITGSHDENRYEVDEFTKEDEEIVDDMLDKIDKLEISEQTINSIEEYVSQKITQDSRDWNLDSHPHIIANESWEATKRERVKRRQALERKVVLYKKHFKLHNTIISSKAKEKIIQEISARYVANFLGKALTDSAESTKKLLSKMIYVKSNGALHTSDQVVPREFYYDLYTTKQLSEMISAGAPILKEKVFIELAKNPKFELGEILNRMMQFTHTSDISPKYALRRDLFESYGLVDYVYQKGLGDEALDVILNEYPGVKSVIEYIIELYSQEVHTKRINEIMHTSLKVLEKKK